MIDESTYRTLDAVASRLFKAGVFPSTVKSADVAFAVILAGYELGFAPMASVRGITLVSGKVSLGADATVAVCARQHDVCAYFSCVTSTDERAEYVTHRVGAPAPVTLSYTIAQARRAGLTANATWRSHTEAMLRARCAAALARSVYPDLVAGVYDPDEAAEIRGDHATAADVRPEAVTLPRDNGRGPSSVSPATAPEDVPATQTPTVDHYDVARALLDGAGTAEELAAARAVIGRDHLGHLGPTERKSVAALRDERARAIAAAPVATPTDGDDPPPAPPRGPRRARKSEATADATGTSADATTAPQGGPAAWLATEDDTTAHALGLTTEWAVQASARKHGPALAATPWGVRVYAQRLQAMGVGTEGQCARYVTAWCAAGPKVRAVAAMPATRAA